MNLYRCKNPTQTGIQSTGCREYSAGGPEFPRFLFVVGWELQALKGEGVLRTPLPGLVPAGVQLPKRGTLRVPVPNNHILNQNLH